MSNKSKSLSIEHMNIILDLLKALALTLISYALLIYYGIEPMVAQIISPFILISAILIFLLIKYISKRRKWASFVVEGEKAINEKLDGLFSNYFSASDLFDVSIITNLLDLNMVNKIKEILRTIKELYLNLFKEEKND